MKPSFIISRLAWTHFPNSATWENKGAELRFKEVDGEGKKWVVKWYWGLAYFGVEFTIDKDIPGSGVLS